MIAHDVASFLNDVGYRRSTIHWDGGSSSPCLMVGPDWCSVGVYCQSFKDTYGYLKCSTTYFSQADVGPRSHYVSCFPHMSKVHMWTQTYKLLCHRWLLKAQLTWVMCVEKHQVGRRKHCFVGNSCIAKRRETS